MCAKPIVSLVDLGFTDAYLHKYHRKTEIRYILFLGVFTVKREMLKQIPENMSVVRLALAFVYSDSVSNY